ncbi:hypothetical protein LINPERHAP2_LOCUS31772, partial [Linum perenne]
SEYHELAFSENYIQWKGVGNGETTLIGACQDRVRTMNKTCDLFPCNYILSSQLAMGAVFGVEPPKQKLDVDISTHITISDDSAERR